MTTIRLTSGTSFFLQKYAPIKKEFIRLKFGKLTNRFLLKILADI